MTGRQTAVGRNLNALIEAKNTKQSAIAAVAGVSNGAVSSWINGRNRPKDKYLEKIADYYDLSLDDLTGDKTGLYAKVHGLTSAPAGAMHPTPMPAVMVPIRVLGTTYANTPDDAPLFEGEAMLYEALAKRHPNCFALEVSGTCMDLVFTPEDYVYVDPDMQPSDGSIAVMLIDGKSETRRYRRGNDTVTLVSESHDPQPDIVIRREEFQEVVCQGVVFWWQAKGEAE